MCIRDRCVNRPPTPGMHPKCWSWRTATRGWWQPVSYTHLEHGQKIQDKAADAGVTPKEYVDKIVATVKDLWKLLDVS